MGTNQSLRDCSSVSIKPLKTFQMTYPSQSRHWQAAQQKKKKKRENFLKPLYDIKTNNSSVSINAYVIFFMSPTFLGQDKKLSMIELFCFRL